MKPKPQGVLLYVFLLCLIATGWLGTFGPLIADPFQQAMCEVAPQLSNLAYQVPEGALWRQESFPLAMENIPSGYEAAVGWVNIANALPCKVALTLGTVELREIRLIEQHRETKEETTIQTITFHENREGFKSALFNRLPVWFGPGEGDTLNWLSRMEHYRDQSLLIDITRTPQRIYHGWTDPRVKIQPGYRHILEVEARVSGSARLQLGLDYWRNESVDYAGYDATCQTSNNCEAWISDWYGDTKGEWQTIRAPQAFSQSP